VPAAQLDMSGHMTALAEQHEIVEAIRFLVAIHVMDF
jgi:hypothetical protein